MYIVCDQCNRIYIENNTHKNFTDAKKRKKKMKDLVWEITIKVRFNDSKLFEMEQNWHMSLKSITLRLKNAFIVLLLCGTM